MTKRRRPYTPDENRWKCPEAVGHSTADVQGKCMYCGRKISAAMPPPTVDYGMSELTQAYGKHYDPDFDVLTYDQIRARYEMGQNL